MEVGKVFSGLALFTLLTMPLYVITMVINITVAACVSTKRMLPFLLAPELHIDEPSEIVKNDEDHDGVEVCIVCASFDFLSLFGI